MYPFAAAVLACRLLALFVLYQGLSSLSLLPLSLAFQSDRFVRFGISGPLDINRPLLLSALPFLVSISFYAFLWAKATWLAGRIVSASPAIEAAPLPTNLQPILLTTVGVLVLVLAIPEAARVVATALLTPNEIAQAPDWVARTVAERWALLLRFLLGFGLTFGALPLSRVLDRLKSD